MSKDINTNEGQLLETLNNKVDMDFQNVPTNSVGFARCSTEVTNCITSVPNRIKYEISGANLIVKAGSEYIYPNGVGVFEYQTMTADKTVTVTGAKEVFMFINAINQGIYANRATEINSGKTNSLEGKTGTIWYDTTNNQVMRTNSDSTTTRASFPIMRAVFDGTTWTEVETFDIAGHMVNSIFVHQGIKGLIPNGRNEDGTLKNTEVYTQVQVLQMKTSYNGEIYFGFSSTSIQMCNKSLYYYDFENNYNKNSTGVWARAPFISTTINKGVIEKFEVIKPFRVVDWNDVNPSKIDGQWVSSYLQLAVQVQYNSTTNTTYDLSSYLPNDGYNYEVIFSATCESPSTSGTQILIQARTDIFNKYVMICRARSDSNTAQFACGTCTLPVGSARQLILGYSTSHSGVYTLNAYGYRRIGKNQ